MILGLAVTACSYPMPRRGLARAHVVMDDVGPRQESAPNRLTLRSFQIDGDGSLSCLAGPEYAVCVAEHIARQRLQLDDVRAKIGQQARAQVPRSRRQCLKSSLRNDRTHVGGVNAHLVPAAWLAIGPGKDLGGVLANSRRRTPHCSRGPRNLAAGATWVTGPNAGSQTSMTIPLCTGCGSVKISPW